METPSKEFEELMSNEFKRKAVDVLVELGEQCYQTAIRKGWWEQGDQRSEAELIALMHSELSEALEEYRNQSKFVTGGRLHAWISRVTENGKPEGLLSEYADVVIRIFDAVSHRGEMAQFASVLLAKMAYNETRPHRHGGKVC